MNAIETFLSGLNAALRDKSFVKMTLSGYAGAELLLKSLHIKPVEVKREYLISVTYRYKTKDVVKNHSQHEAFSIFKRVLEKREFRIANLFTTSADWVYDHSRSGNPLLKQLDPTHKTAPVLSHDDLKKRALNPDAKPWMHALELTDADGNVYKNAQDKFKQINHFIELLRPQLAELPSDKTLHIADMGSGKGYLTFALYDYLTTNLGRKVELTGVESRKELVDLCNQTAKDSGFSGLHFEEGSIDQYSRKEPLDVLVALHACDTATDDALAKGIELNATLIVAAPCCHKQIRREMEQSKTEHPLQFITRYGVFLEREAVMITDSMRAQLLEISGYPTKVVEFVSEANTPKNILLIAQKQTVDVKRQAEIIAEFSGAKAFFGIQKHYLEEKLAAR